MEEIWKDIPGYEGMYQVSNLGRVKSLERKIEIRGKRPRLQLETILKPHRCENSNDGKSYFRVCLYKERKKTKFLLHRLVGENFIPNPQNLEEVNHKDGNKENNAAYNLEWVTHKQNMRHAFNTGLNGRQKLINNKGSKPVAQYDENMMLIAIYPSIHEAERQTGIYQGRISHSVIHGYKAAGFYWKLAK